MNQKHVFGYRFLVTNRNVFEGHENTPQVVFAESKDVNLGKINPITVARTLSDLVGSVENVKNSNNGLIIFCNVRQASILKKEIRFENINVPLQLKTKIRNFNKKSRV